MRHALRLLLFIGVLLPIVSYGQTITMTGGTQTTVGTPSTNGAGSGTPNLGATFTCTGTHNTDSVSITVYTGSIANGIINSQGVGTGSATVNTATLPVGANTVQCSDSGTFAGYFYTVSADPNRSSVSVVDIQDPDGTPLNGTVCFTPVNFLGQIISYSDDGTAAIRPVPACRTITNGAVSVNSIKYTDQSNTVQTLPQNAYYVDLNSEPARIVPSPGTYWPYTQSYIPGSVVVNYTAGSYGDGVEVNNCPQTIISAMMLLVGQWYAYREAVSDTAMKPIPFAVNALLDTERLDLFSFGDN